MTAFGDEYGSGPADHGIVPGGWYRSPDFGGMVVLLLSAEAIAADPDEARLFADGLVFGLHFTRLTRGRFDVGHTSAEVIRGEWELIDQRTAYAALATMGVNHSDVARAEAISAS